MTAVRAHSPACSGRPDEASVCTTGPTGALPPNRRITPRRTPDERAPTDSTRHSGRRSNSIEIRSPKARTLTERPSHAETSSVEFPTAGVNAHTNSTLDFYTVAARADRRSPTIPSLRRSDGRTPARGSRAPARQEPGSNACPDTTGPDHARPEHPRP